MNPAPLEACPLDLDWSDWVPLAEVLDHAPRLPGVYRARAGTAGPVVYIGMAGERNGSNGRPQGIRGRLAMYTSGKGIAGGLGEAALDRALADDMWLMERLTEVSDGRNRRAKSWGVQALVWADLHLSWIVTPDRATALLLETDVIANSDHSALWNRAGVVDAGALPSPRRVPTQIMQPAPSSVTPLEPPPPLHDARRSDENSTDLATQRVTEADLRSGQIRVPGRSKTAFPVDPANIEIVLRGETTICRWNPNGSRSGILRPPRSLLEALVTPDERLRVDDTATPTRLD